MDKLIGKYFNLDKAIKELKNKFKVGKSFLFMINGPRNIGKSYSYWDRVIKNGWLTPNKRIVYLRTTDITIKERSKKDFNQKFYGRYEMTNTHIYELIAKEYINKKGVVIDTKIIKGEIVGYAVGMNTDTKTRSGEFENVVSIFFEEYNDFIYQQDIFNKTIQLLCTIIRFQQCEIILMGNKNTASNQFMVNFGIEKADTNQGKDTWLKIDSWIFYLDIDHTSFMWEENKETIWFNLAKYSPKTKNFMEGSFMDDFNSKVINFNRFIEPTFKAKWKLIIMGSPYIYGSFDKGYCLIEEVYSPNEEVKMFAMDLKSNLVNKAKILDKSDISDLASKLGSQFKNGKLFFSDFYTLQLCETWLTMSLKGIF